MLTNQADPNTFIIRDQTYSAGMAIPLTEDELLELRTYYTAMEKLDAAKISLFEDLHTQVFNASQELACTFYDYDTDRLKWQHAITALVRRVCRRIGGLLPLVMSRNDSGEPQLVVQSLAGTNSSVVLTVDAIRKASGFDRFIGDLRSFGSFINPKGIEKIDPAKWGLFGCPYLVVNNTRLSTEYAQGATEFKWADHEGQNLDKDISSALADMLSLPGRIADMQNGTRPLSFIGGALDQGQLTLLNLSAADKNSDAFRIDLLRSAVSTSSDALFLLQFGPLRREGSTHDFGGDVPANHPFVGISFTLVVRTPSGPIIGSKSWTFVQDAKGEPALKVFGLFENAAGLSSDTATEILKNLLSDVVSV
jgi:hypothetical protein